MTLPFACVAVCARRDAQGSRLSHGRVSVDDPIDSPLDSLHVSIPTHTRGEARVCDLPGTTDGMCLGRSSNADFALVRNGVATGTQARREIRGWTPSIRETSRRLRGTLMVSVSRARVQGDQQRRGAIET